MLLEHGWARPGLVTILLCLAIVPVTRASDGDDLDAYKWRISGAWWFSDPTGFFTGKNNTGEFDLSRDFGFREYSTFTGTADWRFKRKHHLLLGATPTTSSRTVTLSRNIQFGDYTFEFGTMASSNIRSLVFSPGYQYDIIRRNGHDQRPVSNQNFVWISLCAATGTGSARPLVPRAQQSNCAAGFTARHVFLWLL